MFALLILVYFLGLLTGLSIGGPASDPGQRLNAENQAVNENRVAEQTQGTQSQASKDDLAKETKTKPVTPEFKSVSPQAEQPPISEPKKE